MPLHVGQSHATSRGPTHVSAFPLLQTPLTACSKPRKLLQRDGLPPIEARDKTRILDQLSIFLPDQPQERPRENGKEGISDHTGGEGGMPTAYYLVTLKGCQADMTRGE